jgi:hypothetical protein
MLRPNLARCGDENGLVVTAQVIPIGTERRQFVLTKNLELTTEN